MSMADMTRAGGGHREAATRLIRVAGSAVPFGSVWYPEDTGRLLRRLAQQWDSAAREDSLPPAGGLSPVELERLAPGMSQAEFLAYLGDAVEEDGGGEPFPGLRELPVTPAEARIRYPVMARTRLGDPLPAHVRADLHAELRHAAVLFATDDALRANLGHTVDGIRHDMLDAWAATRPGDPAGPGVRAAYPHESGPVDGVPAALLTLCAEEAARSAPEPLTAVTRFLRLDAWGAPLGAIRRVGDVGRDLRSLRPSPEGPYRRLAESLLRGLPDRPDDPERRSILTSLADEVDVLEGRNVPDASELPMSPWEARQRYPSIAGITFPIDYGDRPTLAANLTERLAYECYAGCRMELAQLLAEIVHVQVFFDGEDSLRENLSGEFHWISTGALDEVHSLVEEHLVRCHPPT